MKKFLTIAIVVCGLGRLAVAQPPATPSLQQLYEQHDWFALRDAIAGKSVPAVYAGAVASAFNRAGEAERYLGQAIREAATAEAANDAREVLGNLYMRLARSSDMVRVLRDALAAAPSRSDVRGVLESFEAFSRVPNQTARPGRRRPFACAVRADGVRLPLVVNGKRVEWLFDTAFSHSAMSEGEARMLGITVHAGAATAEGFTGGSTAMRTGVAPRVQIGDAELRNVPVLVFPDSQPPWSAEPPGKRGTVALPAVLPLGGIRWTRGGTCELGAPALPAGRAAAANLAFDGGTPIARVQMSGHSLDVVLDTGNQGGTQLWSRFAREFPDVASAGRKSTKRVEQIGGAIDQEIIAVPSLQLRVGGFDSVLRPANIFSKPVGNDLQHGIIGMDVVSRAAEVELDFLAMTLTMR